LTRARYMHGVFRDMPARYRDIIPDHDRVLGAMLDVGDTNGNILLGAGTANMKEAIRKQCSEALVQLLEDTPVHGWSSTDAVIATYVLYKRADLGGCEIVHSRLYKRNRTRVSHYVMCEYNEEAGLVTYMADVLFFVVATYGDRPPIRYAVSDLSMLHKHTSTVGSSWTTHLGDPKKAGYHKGYGVRVQDMRYKMIKVDAPGSKHSTFLEYASMSGSGRWGSYVGDGGDGEQEDEDGEMDD
jgi:hypothetical protein